MLEHSINAIHSFALNHQLASFSFVILILLLLLLSALNVFGILKGENWRDIQEELSDRSRAMQLARDNATLLGAKNPVELAIVDVTISKAQTRLSRRAHFFMIIGSMCWLVSLGSAWNSLDFLRSSDIQSFLSAISPLYGSKGADIIDGYLLSMWVIRGATLGAAYLSTIIIPGWLGIAFYHEATTLYNRRHAVRFGRLYLYLKCANAQDVSSIDLGDLERALGWNIQTTSAFKDIDLSKLPKSGVSPDSITQIIEALSKLRSEKKPHQDDKNSS